MSCLAGEEGGTVRLNKRETAGRKAGGAVGGFVSYGWDLALTYVPGLVRGSCGWQGLHEDLEAEQAKGPSGFLVHWPISMEREVAWWPGGHKLVHCVGELLAAREYLGEHELVESELLFQLTREGVEGLPELGERGRLSRRVTPVRLGCMGVMHACMPHCGVGVPASEPYQANFGVHGYVMMAGCDKAHNVTWACPPAVAHCLEGVVV